MLDQEPRLLNVYFAGRRGYNLREAIVQERRLLAPANSINLSLSSKVMHKLELCHEKVFAKH